MLRERPLSAQLNSLCHSTSAGNYRKQYKRTGPTGVSSRDAFLSPLFDHKVIEIMFDNYKDNNFKIKTYCNDINSKIRNKNLFHFKRGLISKCVIVCHSTCC